MQFDGIYIEAFVNKAISETVLQSGAAFADIMSRLFRALFDLCTELLRQCGDHTVFKPHNEVPAQTLAGFKHTFTRVQRVCRYAYGKFRESSFELSG